MLYIYKMYVRSSFASNAHASKMPHNFWRNLIMLLQCLSMSAAFRLLVYTPFRWLLCDLLTNWWLRFFVNYNPQTIGRATADKPTDDTHTKYLCLLYVRYRHRWTPNQTHWSLTLNANETKETYIDKCIFASLCLRNNICSLCMLCANFFTYDMLLR